MSELIKAAINIKDPFTTSVPRAFLSRRPNCSLKRQNEAVLTTGRYIERARAEHYPAHLGGSDF